MIERTETELLKIHILKTEKPSVKLLWASHWGLPQGKWGVVCGHSPSSYHERFCKPFRMNHVPSGGDLEHNLGLFYKNPT